MARTYDRPEEPAGASIRRPDSARAVQAEQAAQVLRRRAEEQVRKGAAGSSPVGEFQGSFTEAQHALHELRVHEIELEIQNEELRRTQAELEASRARYFDLYDLAPVGYCTLSDTGLILEANLIAATMLGSARGALVKQPFSRFILREDQDVHYLHLKHILAGAGDLHDYHLRMVRADGTPFWAHIDSLGAHDDEGARVCRLVISDITDRKLAEIYRDMGREVAQILIEPGDVRVYMQRVLFALKTRTGFDAVGIRLQDGDDFPYYVHDGFPADFLRAERTLTGRDADGDVCRGGDGSVDLECTCGLVISGKVDPTNPLLLLCHKLTGPSHHGTIPPWARVCARRPSGSRRTSRNLLWRWVTPTAAIHCERM